MQDAFLPMLAAYVITAVVVGFLVALFVRLWRMSAPGRRHDSTGHRADARRARPLSRRP